MVKHFHRKTKKQYKKNKRNSKKMYGGDFSDMDKNELVSMGFNNEDILLLESNIPNLNLIRLSLQQINPETGNSFTPNELMQSLNENINNNLNEDNNELNLSRISNNSDDSHDLDDLDSSFLNNDDSMNTTNDSNNYSNLNNENELNNNSFSNNDNSLHLSDLNNSNNNSQNTTVEDDLSFGGKRKSRKKRKIIKKRNTRKKIISKKKKSKQKGGQCYGRGVGANNYNPNFSIYNTNELSLFPYLPNK